MISRGKSRSNWWEQGHTWHVQIAARRPESLSEVTKRRSNSRGDPRGSWGQSVGALGAFAGILAIILHEIVGHFRICGTRVS